MKDEEPFFPRTDKVTTMGFPQALEIMENLENHQKKFHAWKKAWNLKIPE